MDPTQPIKISYNMPDDVPLHNSQIVAAIRSENYWNYLHHEFVWQQTVENFQGETEIPPEIWDRVPADDRFLMIGFFDSLSFTWYFPQTYVVPFGHSTFFSEIRPHDYFINFIF